MGDETDPSIHYILVLLAYLHKLTLTGEFQIYIATYEGFLPSSPILSFPDNSSLKVKKSWNFYKKVTNLILNIY